jgi:ribosomal protein L22
MSAHKARRVINQIRGRSYEQALNNFLFFFSSWIHLFHRKETAVTVL